MKQKDKAKRILHLSLKTQPFEVMVSGEKQVEYRDIKPWTTSRLFQPDGSKKPYDLIMFRVGYQPDNPYFICRFKGAEKVRDVQKTYSNGFEVNFKSERWGIRLGEILEAGNLGEIWNDVNR